VQDALKERSQRIYKEYGNVMLDTEGMSKVRRLPSTPEHTPEHALLACCTVTASVAPGSACSASSIQFMDVRGCAHGMYVTRHICRGAWRGRQRAERSSPSCCTYGLKWLYTRKSHD
jgi:hypothetical protein